MSKLELKEESFPLPKPQQNGKSALTWKGRRKSMPSQRSSVSLLFLLDWIDKQLLGQQIPKRYLDGDGNLQMMQKEYPHYGLSAIPSDGYSGQRIVVNFLLRNRSRSSRAPMPRFITRATPRCITFSVRSIIGQGWTPPLKQSAQPALNASGQTDEGRSWI